jgi:L-alanine-DL-glutamate epimerase-like enolase superfamily enzyme
MKITQIEAIPFRLPVRRHFRWASLRAELGAFVLVRVHTDARLTGLGEATPLPDWGGDHGHHGGETQETVTIMIRTVLAPALVGMSALDIERAHAAMARVVRGHSYAKAAIDIALHDLAATAAGIPLYQLLGGACRDQVPVAHMVGIMPEPDAIREAEAAVADGLTALQIKGGEDPDRDIRLVTQLRAKLGPQIRLRLDANQGYRRAKEAIRVVSRLGEGVLDDLEQPVVGLRELAAVTRAVSANVIADESCWDPPDALEVVHAGAADAISIYLAKAGGLAPARDVAAIARAGGLDCDVNGSIESGIGNAANVHFALATPAVRLPCVIPISAPAGTRDDRVGGVYYEDDIVAEAFAVSDGALLPPSGPGLGVELDEGKLGHYRVD